MREPAALPSTVLAQDPASEIPDIEVSEPQSVSSGPAYGIAKTSDTGELWATVHICDTERNPDSMGIRAGMPGNGTDQRMRMRFTAEYWSRARQAWTAVSGTGASSWVYAGSARLDRRQAGWTLDFSQPPEGVTFTMRVQLEFECRRTRRARRRPGGYIEGDVSHLLSEQRRRTLVCVAGDRALP
jgi:hypothetical protein